MVGIFGFNNKPTSPQSRGTRPSIDTNHAPASPPPPYRESSHAPQVYASETTTTTTHIVTTTTQTTTHFFSLPLWRRSRPNPSSSTDLNRQSMPDSLSNQLGLIHPPPNPIVLLRDKDLPPTPRSLIDQDELLGSMGSNSPILPPDTAIGPTKQQLVMSPSRNPSQLSLFLPPKLHTPSDDSPTNPTATLARAALGLGLPPVILNSYAAASSSLELNSVTFVTPPTPASPVDTCPRAQTMRRAKSFQKVPAAHRAESSFVEVMDRRRNRGLSLGPLHFGSDSKGKEKQGEVEPDPRPSMTKSLTRKASFWSRRRTDSNKTNTPVPITLPLPKERSIHPSLPSLQPVSPFYIDTKIPSSSLTPDYSNELRPGDLRRRHSERTPSSSLRDDLPPLDLANIPPSQPSPRRQRPGRPQTADSPENSRTYSSHYPDSAPFVVPSPSRHHIPSVNHAATHKSSSNIATMRPRAQTNPPLLHRLSVNLFGSPLSATPSGYFSGESFTESPPTSLPSSARPSMSRPSVEIPKPRQEDESPEVYLERLLEAVSKAEVATVLALRYVCRYSDILRLV